MNDCICTNFILLIRRDVFMVIIQGRVPIAIVISAKNLS